MPQRQVLAELSSFYAAIYRPPARPDARTSTDQTQTSTHPPPCPEPSGGGVSAVPRADYPAPRTRRRRSGRGGRRFRAEAAKVRFSQWLRCFVAQPSLTGLRARPAPVFILLFRVRKIAVWNKKKRLILFRSTKHQTVTLNSQASGMSALPYGGSAAPLYGGALPIAPSFGGYSAAPYNPYSSAVPSFDPSSYQSYNSLPAGGYPTYIPTSVSPATYTVSAPKAPVATQNNASSETVVVRKILSDDSTLEYYRNNARAIEDSVVSSYQELEREHVALNQKQSQDYGEIFHLETQEVVKFHQKLEAVKNQLSTGVLAKAVDQKLFPSPLIPPSGYPAQQHQVQQGGPGTEAAAGQTQAASQKREHPMIELKKLQVNVRELRKLLQSEVDAELSRK